MHHPRLSKARWASLLHCGDRNLAPSPLAAERTLKLTRAVELALLGHAFERLVGAFDAVLIIVAVGRKQLDDPVRVVGGHMANRPRREVHGLANLKLMLFQRRLLHTQHAETDTLFRATPEFSCLSQAHYSSENGQRREKWQKSALQSGPLKRRSTAKNSTFN